MGSDLGHVSMYYTDEEPPTEQIGKKRHFFAKPSLKGMANAPDNNALALDSGLPPGQPSFKNPDCLQAMLKLYSSPQIKSMIENQFRSMDQNQSGFLRKDDFVNLLFELTREIL